MQRRITSQARDETLGTRLRGLRKARGLTMVQLAGLVEVSQSAVSQWESGREQPARENVVRLARALGTSVGALLGDTVRYTIASVVTLALGLVLGTRAAPLEHLPAARDPRAAGGARGVDIGLAGALGQ